MRSHQQNRWKGLVLGMLGGIVGVLAMRAYRQQVWSPVQSGDDIRR